MQVKYIKFNQKICEFHGNLCIFRGTISLHGAQIQAEDACNFIVSNGGGTQTFHLRASSEVERQRWVTALELAKNQALKVRRKNNAIFKVLHESFQR